MAAAFAAPLRRLLERAWERLSLYLPVALMGLLALGSWWLVRNAPMPLPPARHGAQGQRPDYAMKSFAVRSFDAAGRLQSEVQGAAARHYPGNDTLEIDQARLHSVSAEGRVSAASADRALSNADASQVQLFGNAIVTRESLPARPGAPAQPRLEFRSEYLHAFPKAERVTSDRPVTFIRGQDRFSADSMEYDKQGQVLQLRGRVRGTLMPGSAQRSDLAAPLPKPG